MRATILSLYLNNYVGTVSDKSLFRQLIWPYDTSCLCESLKSQMIYLRSGIVVHFCCSQIDDFFRNDKFL